MKKKPPSGALNPEVRLAPPRVELTVAALVVVTGLLWVFHLYARILPDQAIAAIWLGVLTLLTFVRFWAARIRRERLFAACLAPMTPLRSWFRGGFFLLLWHAGAAAILATALLVGLARLESQALAGVLIAALMLWTILDGLFRWLLSDHVHAYWRPVISARLACWIGVPLLVGGMAALALDRPQPDLAGVELDRALWHFVDREQAQSTILELALEITAALEGLRHWLMQQFLPGFSASPLLLSLGWFVILVGHALFAFAMMSLLHSVRILIDARERRYCRFAPREEESHEAL